MFEALSAAGLIDVITARARASAVAEAEKYAAIAELERRRLRDGVEWEGAAADATDGTAAEISAALNIGHGRALGEIDIATMLRDKFPKLFALFLLGLVTGRRMWLLEKRTDLVIDPDAIARLDRALADRIVSWGPLSEWKFEQLVDAEIGRIDPAAVHRVKEQVRDRDFVIGRRDGSGTVAYWGRMSDPDAAISVANIRRMIRSVCPDDPRTMKQRRGDALAALIAGSAFLKCLCGNPECPAAAVPDAAAENVVIHVITDQATLDAVTTGNAETTATDAECDGFHGPRTVEGELGEIIDEIEDDAQHEADTRTEDAVEEPPVPDDLEDEGWLYEPDPDADSDVVPSGADPYADTDTDRPVTDEPCPPETDPEDTTPGEHSVRARPVAVIADYGVMPPVLLGDLIGRGAKIRPIDLPGSDADPGYRPRAATDRFVRQRDLTCRAPGCDQPAEYADIDHTIPYPAGPTHPGGLKCDCRKHLLVHSVGAGRASTGVLPVGCWVTRKTPAVLGFQCDLSTAASGRGP